MKRPATTLLCSLLLLLQGCLAPGQSPQEPAAPAAASAAPTAETLFLQGLEELEQKTSPPAFDELHRSFPGSAWTLKTEFLTELSSSRRQLAGEIRRLRKELASEQKRREQANAEIDKLQGDLQRMKEVLIETELRSQ